MRFSISAIAAFCMGSTSGSPMNWRASSGVQSTLTVIFIGQSVSYPFGVRPEGQSA